MVDEGLGSSGGVVVVVDEGLGSSGGVIAPEVDGAVVDGLDDPLTALPFLLLLLNLFFCLPGSLRAWLPTRRGGGFEGGGGGGRAASPPLSELSEFS